MSKHKKGGHRARQAQPRASAPDRRQDGLRAFQAGRLDAAIGAWTNLAPDDPKVAAALAEAQFRRALLLPAGDTQREGLRQALALAPDEPRYRYHLGLSLHRAGDVSGASEQYRAVLARDAAWPGAALVLALATLEQDPHADLAELPGSAPTVQAALAPVQALLHGQIPRLVDLPAGADDHQLRAAGSHAVSSGTAWESTGPVTRLWYGLGLIQEGNGAARAVLDDTRSLPAAQATRIRRYYWGVAAAQGGDREAARKAWQLVSDGGLDRPWLRTNLGAALLDTPADSASDKPLAPAVSQQAALLATSNPALAEALVGRLDATACATAARGEWVQAAELWERARQVVSTGSGLGSPRPLLHNLALAYEAQERWGEAADAWRAMLRTQPRQGRPHRTKAGGAGQEAAAPRGQDRGPTDAQWAWVRKRVIECYKRAGTPGEAVALFRQAIKADPHDVEARLQLADALLANDQEGAAFNELQRILAIDAQNIDTQLRLASIHGDRGAWHAALSILRPLVGQHPERQDALRVLAQLLLRYAHHREEMGYATEAAALLKEGQRLVPDEYHFPLRLARLSLIERKPDEAGDLLERTLELGAAQPEAYVAVIDCWAVAGDFGAARAVLARAEAGLTLTAHFYVRLGTTLLLTSGPARVLLQERAKPRGRSRTIATATTAEDVWLGLAREMLDRATALAPGDSGVPMQIATELLTQRPELALPYAEQAARRMPDDPAVLTLLGLVLALNERAPEAQQTLRRAARMARQQGKLDEAQHAEEMAQQVASPLLRLSMEMARIYEEAGIDPEDLF